MAKRITKQLLRDRVAGISRSTGVELTVGWAYGSPRIYTDGESREVSPRLPIGQLYEWVNAWDAGYWKAHRQHRHILEDAASLLDGSKDGHGKHGRWDTTQVDCVANLLNAHGFRVRTGG